MAKPQKQLKEIKKEVNSLQKQFSGGSSDSRDNISEGLQMMLSGVLTLAGIGVAFLLIPGITVAGLLTQHTDLAIGIVGLYIAMMYIAGSSARTFSFPFAIITIGVGMMLWSFVPDPIASVFVWEQWLGVELPQLNGLSFLVLATTVAGIYWAVSVRVSGKAKKPEKIFDRVAKKYAKVIDIYTAMAGIAVLIGFYALFAAAGNFAGIAGTIGSVLGAQPFVPSNLFAIVAGYLGLGGDLPIVGSLPYLNDLTSVEFAFVTLLVFGISVAAYYEASGPSSRLFRRFD